MTKFAMLLVCIIFIYGASAQNLVEDNQQKPKRFHIGIHYAFLQNEMEIQSLKSQSIWAGEDFGTNELSNEEIDEINSLAEYEKKVQGPYFEVCMILLDKPEKPLFIDIKIMVGMAVRNYKIYDLKTGITELKIKSKILNPWLGIGAKFKYNFSESWGIELTPMTNYSWGTSDDIDDNLYPVIQTFIEKRTDKSSFWYSRVNLMACYSFRNFTFSAGPGFYLSVNHHEYRIERTDPDDGYTYLDIITSKLVSKYFIDASIGLNLKITDYLTFTASGSFAKDVFLFTGLNYNF